MPGLCIIPSRALDDEECRGARMTALLAIGTYTSRDGSGVWAANETIADRAKLDERDYRRAVSWLVERGYVRKRTRYKASGAQDTNLLQIVLDEPDEPALPLVVQGGGVISPTPLGGEGSSTPPREGSSTPPPLGEIPPPRGGVENPTKRTPLNVPTTNTTSATLEAKFEDARHRDAYLALRRDHRNPPLLDIALRTVHQPPTGGAAYAWPLIGAGLVEQLGNGESFNVSRLRGYCRSAQQPDLRMPRAPATPAAGAGASLGGSVISSAAFWDLCVMGGLAAGMQSRDTLAERVQVLHREGRVGDPAVFLALVLHVKPWALAEIKFRKERDERLAAALNSFTAPATQEVA